MGTAVLEIPKVPFEIGSLGAFFEPSPVREIDLVKADERLIADLAAALDKQLLSVIDTRSLAEFSIMRKAAIPRYIRALRALLDTAKNLVTEDQIERISKEVITYLSSDFEKQGPSHFGSKLTEQALFSLWTLEKIR